MTFRERLVRNVEAAEEQLRLWDLGQTPLPHALDCACPLWECLKRRLDALPPLDATEEEWQSFQKALEDAGEAL